MSRNEKQLKETVDDEIKVAGLEASVPEQLVKHSTPNSGRLPTFEDVRLKIVTYVEVEFVLRTRDSSRLNWGLEDTLIQWMLT